MRRAGIKICQWTSGPNYEMFWALRRESGRSIRRALRTNHVQTRSPETEHDVKPRSQKADRTETRPNPCYQLGTKGPSWLQQTKVEDARGSTSGDRLGGEHAAGNSGGSRRLGSQPQVVSSAFLDVCFQNLPVNQPQGGRKLILRQ